MDSIIRGTNATIQIKIRDDLNFSTITSLELHIYQYMHQIVKTLNDLILDADEHTITYELTQEESLSLVANRSVEITAICMANGKRFETRPIIIANVENSRKNDVMAIEHDVIVDVHEVNLEHLIVTENGTYEPGDGIDGYDMVTVAIPPTVPNISQLTITDDGTYTASGDGYNPVTVNTGVGTLRDEIQNAEEISGCNPLIDGLTALTTYANEVTGAEDTTLSDAVETLAGKYGKAEFNPFKYTYSMQDVFFRNAELPEALVIDFEGNSSLTSMNNAFRNASGIKHLVFKNLQSNRVGMTCMLFLCTSIETLEFIDCAFGVNTFETFTTGAGSLQEIIGELDFTPCINARAGLSVADKLKEFRIKQNSISVGLSGGFFSNSNAYSDESLISFGNALSQDAPNTVKIEAKPKAKCYTILGNNIDGTFIADKNGSMTLIDFITTVKGWTVT